MLNQIKYLENKIDELESKINNLSKTSASIQESGVSYFTNNLVNYSLTTKKQIKLANFDLYKINNLFFDAVVKFNLSSAQTIDFVLSVNNIALTKSSIYCSNGHNEVTLMGQYLPLTTGKITVKLTIFPKLEKLVVVSSANLAVWGISASSAENEYNVTTVGSQLLLSFIDNEKIYYKYSSKQLGEYLADDFNYYAPAISHSAAYLTNATLYLFRVTPSGLLIMTNKSDSSEKCIETGVSKVSSTSDGTNVYVSFIKDNQCFVVEISNGVIYKPKQISVINIKFTDSYIYYNDKLGKVYLIVTADDNSNYMLESIAENCNYSESLSASYSINITTYGVS